MSVTQAFETTATVDTPRSLQLDEPLPAGVQRVRVIVLQDESGAEIGETEWLHAASSNASFDFLRDPAEDIYSWEDGAPSDER